MISIHSSNSWGSRA